MYYRSFGDTDLKVSEIGFGAWAIGGPAMAGNIPLGWGDVDDQTSKRALIEARECGVNFFDTADFYGFGHSEKLIGEAFGNRDDVIVATKAGQRLAQDGTVYSDYSEEHLRKACHDSLKRLQRDSIDLLQLHTAKQSDLKDGTCVQVLEDLKQEGKIRYWGVSLNTHNPHPEADYMLTEGIGDAFQLVFNIINQESLPILEKARQQGMGVIARMPFQFGVLTGKFTKQTRFDADDHRSFRLPPDVLAGYLDALEEVWPLTDKYGVSKTELSLSFILSFEGVSTAIPGIKTPEQVHDDTSGIVRLRDEDRDFIASLYEKKFRPILL